MDNLENLQQQITEIKSLLVPIVAKMAGPEPNNWWREVWAEFARWFGTAIVTVGTVYFTAKITRDQTLPNALAQATAGKVTDRAYDLAIQIQKVNDAFDGACAGAISTGELRFRPDFDSDCVKLHNTIENTLLPATVKTKLRDFINSINTSMRKLQPQANQTATVPKAAAEAKKEAAKAFDSVMEALERFLYGEASASRQ